MTTSADVSPAAPAPAPAPGAAAAEPIPPPPPGADKIDRVLRDYYHVQSAIEKIDERTMTIKAWSITFSMAGVAFALEKQIPVVLLLSAASAMLFWVIDVYWKGFQAAFYFQTSKIEHWFRGDFRESLHAPAISGHWTKGWRKQCEPKNVLTTFFRPQNALPHAIVAVVAIVLYLNFDTLHLTQAEGATHAISTKDGRKP
jgi:hypothetical protein